MEKQHRSLNILPQGSPEAGVQQIMIALALILAAGQVKNRFKGTRLYQRLSAADGSEAVHGDHRDKNIVRGFRAWIERVRAGQQQISNTFPRGGGSTR